MALSLELRGDGRAAAQQEDRVRPPGSHSYTLRVGPSQRGLQRRLLENDPEAPRRVERVAAAQWLRRAASGMGLDIIFVTLVTGRQGVRLAH